MFNDSVYGLSRFVLRSVMPVVLVVVGTLQVSPSATAQSCVLTRLDTPVMNAFDDDFTPAGAHQRFQASMGHRYGYSFRHFVGTDEQEERMAEHSQVVNNVNIVDLSMRYNLSSRTSFTVGVPYLTANRDGALRNGEGHVIARYTRSQTEGLGDITVVAKHLLWDPAAHRRSNLSVGLGVKVPTGDYRQKQSTLSLRNGAIVRSDGGIADYSVQPGDGAWGIITEASGYRILNKSGSFALYGSGTYIFEPETHNGVARPNASIAEEFVSATDQYVARLGVQIGPKSWRGFGLGLGGRIEGVPPHDVFGSSFGRRRPGYMASIEPSFSYSWGVNSISMSVPWAVERNRQRSVSDLIRGSHGDAAFPDYVVLTNYAVRF
jgi:outer membrane putative beta-barrel porin/alpha-amylase